MERLAHRSDRQESGVGCKAKQSRWNTDFDDKQIQSPSNTDKEAMALRAKPDSGLARSATAVSPRTPIVEICVKT
jgi:hypothetical protein